MNPQQLNNLTGLLLEFVGEAHSRVLPVGEGDEGKKNRSIKLILVNRECSEAKVSVTCVKDMNISKLIDGSWRNQQTRELLW